MSLYIGGGVVAALASFGDRLRHFLTGHRVATATVTVAAASVAAVGAFTAFPSGDDAQAPETPVTSSEPVDEHGSDNDAEYETAEEDELVPAALPDELTNRLLRVVDPTEEATSPDTTPAPVTGDDSREEAGAGIPPPPASSPPASTTPAAPVDPDEPTPTTPPVTAPPTAPQMPPADCTLDVKLADLDLCLR
ncbi:hypothetical protein ACFY7V_03895 [[Kitasatospora] papulosa]|uniref:hypothetical protein n=1 Tax=Streptomyces TaxID=1883 RepID=UPI002FEE8974